MSKQASIFFHYHPDDDKYFRELYKYLPRSVKKVTQIYHSGDKVLVGENRAEKQMEWLAECQLYIPLAGPNFWNDDPCYELHEEALKVREKKKFIPILVADHLDNEASYTDIQVLPEAGKFLDSDGTAETYTAIARTLDPVIQSLFAKEDKSAMIQLFTESVFRLNYKEQKRTVYDHYKKLDKHFHRLQITFLQGTPHCGHNLLIDILRRTYQIEMETEPEAVPLDMTNLQAPALWRELKNALLLKDVAYDKPEEIAQNINQRLQLEHIVLRFENFGQCDKKAVLQCIRDFWFQLNSQLEKVSPQKPPHSVFIFILDRSLNFSYSLDDFKRPEDANQHSKVLQLLPIISPLTEEEFTIWVESLFDAEGLKFRPIYDKLCGCSPNIIPEDQSDGVFVKQAIENMAAFLELGPYKSEIIESLKL
ncbi:MAG: hypothetical protein HRU41_05350 [Saprospiraceae bacterium]|nr:hypothetical protein [Saprospiraceae bacterium]